MWGIFNRQKKDSLMVPNTTSPPVEGKVDSMVLVSAPIKVPSKHAPQYRSPTPYHGNSPSSDDAAILVLPSAPQADVSSPNLSSTTATPESPSPLSSGTNSPLGHSPAASAPVEASVPSQFQRSMSLYSVHAYHSPGKEETGTLATTSNKANKVLNRILGLRVANIPEKTPRPSHDTPNSNLPEIPPAKRAVPAKTSESKSSHRSSSHLLPLEASNGTSGTVLGALSSQTSLAVIPDAPGGATNATSLKSRTLSLPRVPVPRSTSEIIEAPKNGVVSVSEGAIHANHANGISGIILEQELNLPTARRRALAPLQQRLERPAPSVPTSRVGESSSLSSSVGNNAGATYEDQTSETPDLNLPTTRRRRRVLSPLPPASTSGEVRENASLLSASLSATSFGKSRARTRRLRSGNNVGETPTSYVPVSSLSSLSK